MITLGIVIFIVGFVVGDYIDGHSDWCVTKLGSNSNVVYVSCIALLAGIIAAISWAVSFMNVPDDYQKVENYSYVTADGAVEAIEGLFFKKGDTYYIQEMGLAGWVPFGQCEYVEVDLPESVAAVE